MCPTCLVPFCTFVSHVPRSLLASVPQVFLPICALASHVPRAFHVLVSCLTFLVPYMLTCPTCFVSFTLTWITCLVPYEILCITCFVPYVPSCLTPNVICFVCSRVLCPTSSHVLRVSSLLHFRPSCVSCPTCLHALCAAFPTFSSALPLSCLTCPSASGVSCCTCSRVLNAPVPNVILMLRILHGPCTNVIFWAAAFPCNFFYSFSTNDFVLENLLQWNSWIFEYLCQK